MQEELLLVGHCRIHENVVSLNVALPAACQAMMAGGFSLSALSESLIQKASDVEGFCVAD